MERHSSQTGGILKISKYRMTNFIKGSILIFLTYIAVFFLYFLNAGDSEFIFYILVTSLIFSFVIYGYLRGIQYTKLSIAGLLVWGFLHLLGGVGISDGDIVYGLILWDFIGEPYNILKYDQVVHFFGFAATALTVFDVIRPQLKELFSMRSVIFVVICASMGLGALNEILEFIATLLFEEVNVGGYENTGIDLVSNAFGAFVAGMYIVFRSSENRSQK